MFWFCTNCTIIWIMGMIFQKLHTQQSEILFFHNNFNLSLLRCWCRSTKRFSIFRPQLLPWQSSTIKYQSWKILFFFNNLFLQIYLSCWTKNEIAMVTLWWTSIHPGGVVILLVLHATDTRDKCQPLGDVRWCYKSKLT